MKREELRKVVIISDNYVRIKRFDNGYFHQWYVAGNLTDGIGTYGIIENEKGECFSVSVGDFKFID